MNKSVIRISIIIVLLVSIFFIVFGFKKVDGGDIKFYIKVKNKNTSFNFMKPSPASFLKNEDLILYKDARTFDKKFSQKDNFSSRLIGKPGDTILINNSKVYVNNKALNEDYDIYFKYRITTSDSTNIEELLSPFDVQTVNIINDIACDIITTQNIADNISKEIKDIQNIRKIINIKGTYLYEIFPFDPLINWNPDNFGPVTIPQKGATVNLNRRNIALYKDIISAHENNELIFDHSQIRINGKAATSYTFKKDYFFVLNDYRLNYNDSRKFGFIPEDLITGKYF